VSPPTPPVRGSPSKPEISLARLMRRPASGFCSATATASPPGLRCHLACGRCRGHPYADPGPECQRRCRAVGRHRAPGMPGPSPAHRPPPPPSRPPQLRPALQPPSSPPQPRPVGARVVRAPRHNGTASRQNRSTAAMFLVTSSTNTNVQHDNRPTSGTPRADADVCLCSDLSSLKGAQTRTGL
jgi:hypothetical protein